MIQPLLFVQRLSTIPEAVPSETFDSFCKTGVGHQVEGCAHSPVFDGITRNDQIITFLGDRHEIEIERFCGALKPFLDKSHFIVITHHKSTMRSCDQLYGVTMQERGVSTRVSVRVEDIQEDGRISDAAVKRAAKDEAPLDPPLIETKPFRDAKAKQLVN